MDNLLKMAQVGRPAPDFEAQALVDDRITTVRLSDYAGQWVILFFYPGDFTFVCPTELIAIAERSKEFRALGVNVLSISVDSPHVHKAWQEHELSKMVTGGFPYPMVSDRGGRIGATYVVYDEDSGYDLRGFFVVDPDGTLQVAHVLPNSMSRDISEMLRLVQGAQYVYARKDEVLPACWHPGYKTIKPDEELIGKIWMTWRR